MVNAMSDVRRTGVQRRTLAGALLLAAVSGAGLLAIVDQTDGGGSTRISDTVESTTTVEETTTSEEPTTTAAPTTVAPAPFAAPVTAAPSVEQQVADHEQRIDTLEATTTTAAAPRPTDPPATTSTTSASTTTTLYLG